MLIYKESPDLSNSFKDAVRNKSSEYLNPDIFIKDFKTVQKYKETDFPFKDKELATKIKKFKKLGKTSYEKIFEQMRKNEKLFNESIGSRGEVRKELYLPHIGQFIILDAFIRKGEESFAHRHKLLKEIYKIEYGELTFVDSKGVYPLEEGDIIIFEPGNQHTYIMEGDYAVISVIKDFSKSMNTVMELKLNVKMDWYAACEQVPRVDIINLREKRKHFKKILNEFYNMYEKMKG